MPRITITVTAVLVDETRSESFTLPTAVNDVWDMTLETRAHIDSLMQSFDSVHRPAVCITTMYGSAVLSMYWYGDNSGIESFFAIFCEHNDITTYRLG